MPDYVPYLAETLILCGEAAGVLDIAMLLVGQFRLQGDHLGAFLRDSRCAGSRHRRHIGRTIQFVYHLAGKSTVFGGLRLHCGQTRISVWPMVRGAQH